MNRRYTLWVIGINLAIMLAYTIGINMSYMGSSTHDAGMGVVILTAFCLAIHVALTILIGTVLLVMKKREQGGSFMLASLVVLIIGFSACLGSITILDKMS